VLIQLVVGLLVPVLAALVPILSAVRVTAREAMSDYGLNPTKKRGRFDRMIDRIRGFSRPVLLSLRNTFRRKGRLVLTLTTLVLGGAIFIGVFTVRDSLLLTLDDMFDYVDYDAMVGFKRGYRIEQIEEEALKVPGVNAAESWRFSTARRLRDDDTESENLSVYAPPPQSKLVNPNVIQGRWLLPDDENAIVVNTLFLKDEKDVKVGDTLTLKMEGDESAWQVVGIIKGTPPAAMAYVNLPYFSRVVGGVGRGGVVFTTSDLHDMASQRELAKALEEHYESVGMQVGNTQISATERAQIESQFNVLVVFLLIMAILLAVVGGIGLMGTMSLNVMERTREIGVMRAIGATDGSIFKIVVIEGIVIGLLSWVIGAVLAYPLSVGLSNAVGISILQAPLSYQFSIYGAGLWLVVVIVLAGVASLWPARNASRVTVREVLAYE
jgi:putative ABC transport system permease protein